MAKQPITIFELMCLVIACTVCLFILMEGIVIMRVPTNPANVEVRKQIISVLNFLAGGVMGILATKITSRPQNDATPTKDESK